MFTALASVITVVCLGIPAELRRLAEKEEADYKEQVATFAELDARFGRSKETDVRKQSIAELRKTLAGAEKVELLRIRKPFSTRDRFHNFGIDTRSSIESVEDKAKIVKFLGDSLHWNDACMAACFSPGYRVRIATKERTLDLLICFGCNRVDVYEGGKVVAVFALRPVRCKDLLLESMLASVESKRAERWDESDKLLVEFDRELEARNPKLAMDNKQAIAGLVGRLSQANEIRLFAIKPKDPFDDDVPKEAKKFHNYEIIAETKTSDVDTRKRIVGLMESKLHRHDLLKGACFNPRHGLRFVLEKSEIDLVVCFECWQVYCYEGEKSLGGFGLATVRPNENLLERMLFDPGAKKTDK